MDLQTFLLGATVFLGAAIIFVPIAHRLGLGSVMGYLFAGILIGPVFGIVKDAETLAFWRVWCGAHAFCGGVRA